MLAADDAVARVLAHATALPAHSCPLHEGLGRVLAADLRARWDLPSADLSVMDGYAIRSEDLELDRLAIAGESAAGHPSLAPLSRGEAMPISTGAVLPPGADTVVPREDTERDGSGLRLTERPSAGRWVRPRGCDIRQGEVIVSSGTVLGASDLAAAAAVGHSEIRVHQRPRVAVCSTGDELVALGQTPNPGQIVGTNALMLAGLASGAGATVIDLGQARDNPSSLEERLGEGLRADVLVTSGGVSVGEHDLVVPTLERLGCTIDFHGIAVRPGRPAALARRDRATVLALPGNPASTLVGFWLLLRPLLRRLLGVQGDPTTPRIRVRLRTAARGAGKRAHFVRARLHHDGTATPLLEQRSGNLTSMVDVDALVIVPAGCEAIDAGESAEAMVIEPWWTERRPS